MKTTVRFLTTCCLLATFLHCPNAPAAPAKDPLKMKDPDWVDGRINDIDHGRFMHYSFSIPKRHTPKGIAIKVGKEGTNTVCFDTLLCSYAGAWTGGFLEFSSRRFGFMKNAEIIGNLQYSTATMPGLAPNGDFKDTRERRSMPLPANRARYEGMYRTGEKTVLHYTANGASVLDHPWAISAQGMNIFTRAIEVGPSKQDLHILIASHPRSKVTRFQKSGVKSVQLEQGKNLLTATVIGGNAELKSLGKDHLTIHIPARDKKVLVKVFVCKTTRPRLPAFAALVKKNQKNVALPEMDHPLQWTESIVTRGRVGLPLGPFAIDTITLPFENSYNALFFAGGHDFLPNGDALLATAHGDVWLVKGIDEKLQKITWQRFATGLYQPLGLKIVKERIYVLGKDQITELQDLNKDGEADYYRNFSNLNEISGGGHNYATCLETDPEGNFWFIRCNDRTPHGGTLLRVSPNGRSIKVVSTGFRNPNGMGVSPAGVVTAADQQGTWIPETRLDICKQGGFYGFVPSSKRETQPTSYDGPLCWVPRIMDNSAGGQTWVPKGLWGPLSERMIHISYGRCKIMAILEDENKGGVNGGIVGLPGRFQSGVMRGRFRKQDGHLYLSGLKGWQTVGLADGAFQRVRFTGRNLFIPTDFSVHQNGIKLSFNEPLKKDLAEDLGSYNAEMWNYLWSKNYGSDDYSVLDPKKKGRDPLEVKSARLLTDGKTVFLEMPGIRKAHQVALQYNLTTAKGQRKRDTFHFTINSMGKAR